MTQEPDRNVFRLTQVGTRPYEYTNNVHAAIAYELDLNLATLDRQVYSVLDFMGDIGGLSEALVFLGSIYLGIIHYGQFNGMLTALLYRAKKLEPEPAKLTMNKVEKS